MADDDTLFELEATRDREALAVLVGDLAWALETGQPTRIALEDRTATIEFPERLEFELEAEAGGEDPRTIDLDLELEWEESERAPSVRLEAVDEGDESDGPSGADGDGDPVPDSASATMSASAGEAGSADAVGSDDEAPESAPVDAENGGRSSRFEVYRDRADQWRWRLVHWNGNIVADSGEGYASRYNATRAAQSVKQSVPTAEIDQLE